jgi:hypothetical protein
MPRFSRLHSLLLVTDALRFIFSHQMIFSHISINISLRAAPRCRAYASARRAVMPKTCRADVMRRCRYAPLFLPRRADASFRRRYFLHIS